MFQSGNHRFLKALNQKHILNLLRMHAGLTARELSERTGLKIATVLNLLNELEASGQIVKKDFGRSTKQGGKRPVIWDINPDFGLALGVEWLSTQVRMVLINFNLQIIAQQTVEIAPGLKDQQKIDFFILSLKNFLAEKKKSMKQVLGLGIGLAGIVDFERGCVVSSWSFAQKKFPLKERLAEELPFPVYLDNESNAGVLGLKWLLPELFETANIAYLTIHQCFSGMGSGFIFNHQLYRGKQNATGEWPPLFNKVWRNELSQKVDKNDPFFARLISEKKSLPEICQLVRELSSKHESIGTFFWQHIAEPILERLRLLSYVLDPEVVVLGGDIFEMREFLEPVIRKKINQWSMPSELQRPQLIFSPFGSYTNALGAAVTVLNEVYNS